MKTAQRKSRHLNIWKAPTESSFLSVSACRASLTWDSAAPRLEAEKLNPGSSGSAPPPLAGNPHPGLTQSTLHRASVGQGPPGPDWLATALGFWSGRVHGTRFETMAILAKELQCATKRLHASMTSPSNLPSKHLAPTPGPTRPPRPRCRIRSALRLRPSAEAPHGRATTTLRRGFVPAGAIAVGG